jgi:hypothetical protein
LIKDVINPRKQALARARVALAHEAVQLRERQAVNLHHDEALCLSLGRGMSKEDANDRDKQKRDRYTATQNGSKMKAASTDAYMLLCFHRVPCHSFSVPCSGLVAV